MEAVMEELSETRETGSGASPGTVLRSGRERLAMTVSDVARELRLSVRQVEAIEADNYAKLPGGPFARGFIRNYARLVGVEPEPLIQIVNGQVREEDQSARFPASKEIPFPSGHARPWSRYVVVVVMLAAALALLAYESYREYLPQFLTGKRQGTPAPTAPAALPAAAPRQQSVTPGTEAQSPAPPASGQPPFEAVVPGSRSAGQAQPEQAAATQPEQALEPGVVRIQFGHESWVEIRDRDGKVLFTGTNPADSEQVVEGNPPLALVIGHASKVRLTWRDMPVDLVPYTKVDVARVTLE
jgi:cytoskeleton protein RodZ